MKHLHVNIYFATPMEHNRKLAQGAVRAMIQLLERTRGKDPSPGFTHMLAALLEGMQQLTKEIE